MPYISLELKVDNEKTILAEGIILDNGKIVWTRKNLGDIKPSHGKYNLNDVYKQILKKCDNYYSELNIRIRNQNGA